MDCEERAALLALYQERAQSFWDALNTLHDARAAKWQEGFMKHWDAAHLALTGCIAAQDKLVCHVSAHRCESIEQIFEKSAA